MFNQRTSVLQANPRLVQAKPTFCTFRLQTPQYAKSPQTQSYQALRSVGTNYEIVLFNLVPIQGNSIRIKK